MLTTFISGAIVSLHLVIALFFLKFYRKTHDWLFVAFALAFGIEGLNRIRFLLIEHPNEGSFGIYAVRAVAFLIVLVAILAKNLEGKRQR